MINLVKSFILIHILIMGLVLATNNPAREYIFQKSQLISAKISSNQMTDKSDKSASGISDLSIVRFLADFSRDSDFSGTGLRKSEHGGTESGDIRRLVWSGAIQLVKQRPVFGFGPETFGETYWRVRPKEHNLTSEWNFLYNKAHNEWLNLAANTGIFGLGSHLLLLGWFTFWSLKHIVNSKHQAPNFKQAPSTKFQTSINLEFGIWNLAALAAVVGVEAVNFFGFSTVTVGVYRYLFMGLAVVSASEGRILKGVSLKARWWQVSSEPGRLPFTVYCLLFTVVFAILYLISQISIFFLADLAYNRGRAYQDGGYVEEAVEPLTQAVNLAPGEPVFRAELAEAEGTLAALLPARLTDNSVELKNNSIANFEIVRRQSPENLGFVRTEARVLFISGNCTDNAVARSLDSSRRESGLARDDDNLCEEAVQLMKAAMEMAPTNPQLPYSLGQMFSKMGNEEEAKVYFNKAAELKPDYSVISNW